jgi:SAM-dependent methyltransferase/ketosteroid isomerase-like protein
MPDRTELIHHLIAASNGRRFDEYAAAFHEDAVIEYPQSGERILGRANALAMFRAYATPPTFDAWRIDASGDIAVVHATGHYPDSEPWHVLLEYQFAGHDRTRDGVLRRVVPASRLAKRECPPGEVHVTQEQGDAAMAYETLMVPALFGEWAPRVADAAGIQTSDRVLDVACGTGILAREIKSRLAGSGFVSGVDRMAGMVDVAGRLAPDVDWRTGSAESLPYRDGAFDAVVSQFGLMFFGDRVRALREMQRVLVPDGRLAVAVWDDIEEMPAYAAELELLDRLAGPAAADALRAPFVLGDAGALASIFERAGAESVRVETQRGTGRFPSARVKVEADLRGWLPVMGVVLPEELIQEVLEEAAVVLRPWIRDDETIAFETSAHIVTAARPS